MINSRQAKEIKFLLSQQIKVRHSFLQHKKTVILQEHKLWWKCRNFQLDGWAKKVLLQESQEKLVLLYGWVGEGVFEECRQSSCHLVLLALHLSPFLFAEPTNQQDIMWWQLYLFSMQRVDDNDNLHHCSNGVWFESHRRRESNSESIFVYYIIDTTGDENKKLNAHVTYHILTLLLIRSHYSADSPLLTRPHPLLKSFLQKS